MGSSALPIGGAAVDNNQNPSCHSDVVLEHYRRVAASLIFGKNSHRRQTCKDSNARLRCAVRTVMVPAIKMNPEQGRAEKAVLRHVSDLPRFGRCCGPPSWERRAALHWFDSHDGKSLIGVRVDDQAESSGNPEFRQKVRHGLNAVHGFNAAEFDPGCPRQLAIVPENPQHGFGVVRRMCGSSHVRLCLFTGRARCPCG